MMCEASQLIQSSNVTPYVYNALQIVLVCLSDVRKLTDKING